MRPIDGDVLREIVENGLRNNPHKDGYARVCHRSEYTHFLDVIQRMPTIAPPPNDPLTLETLRGMDGEPVWCINGNGGQWGLVHVFSAEGETYVECVSKTGFTMDKMTYGATGIYAWLAYRRKPEEGAKESAHE